MKNEIRGYKVFNPDWTCRGFQYAVGEIFEENIEPLLCTSGFHFCLKPADCFSYYHFDSKNKVAEVVALGEVDTDEYVDGLKCCTNKIQIVREIPWQEVLELVNTGKGCTGLCNTGDCNTGDCNTGKCNTGSWNTGDCNTGKWNTGDWNTGDCNTGDWNTTNFSSGCFNTEEQKIHLFNKPSDWTYRDWINSDARYLLNQIPRNVVEWTRSSEMKAEEKEAHPEHETTGGYLKVLDETDCAQIWWDRLPEDDRQIIKEIPNFDKAIFESVTGIVLDE